MRILYGVTGEGLGHTMRARVLVAHLVARGHSVRIAASGRAAAILGQHHPDVIDIRGLELVYRNGALERLRTVGRNARHAPRALLRNLAAGRRALEFSPEVVVSDFDSFSYAVGRLLDRPIVSFDHQHVLSRCVHEREVLRRLSYDFSLARGVVARKLPRCARYLVTSFYFPSLRDEHAGDTLLLGPVVRDLIARQTPSQGEHVLVYQTGSGDARLLDLVHALDRFRFRVYGPAPRPAPAHVEYRAFSEEGFAADLAAARAVIANGGYTTLSEALCLGKPVVSVPIRHQGEQELNAAYLARDGLGHSLPRPSLRTLARDLDDAIARGPRPPVRAPAGEAARALDQCLKEVA